MSIDLNRAKLKALANELAKDIKTEKDLNGVTLYGIRYAHLIVIECAMYLYDRLLDESSIEQPGVEIYRVTPGISCSLEQAESPRPDWVRYEGGMMVSFSGAPKLVRHKIKVVN